MRPSRTNNAQGDLFRQRLSNQLNPKHELLQLGERFPWERLESELKGIFAGDELKGRPAKPVRLMVGLLLLQHMHKLSDEEVVRSWVENPYWQHFCGFDHLQWQFPINPSSLTRWRKRLGSEHLEKLLGMSVEMSVDTGVVSKSDLQEVIVDTTVMEKNIEFPSDIKLLEKARKSLVKLAEQYGVSLRQNYNLVSKKILRKIGGYLHARQMKRARKASKSFATLVGRVMRDIERKIAGSAELGAVFVESLCKTEHLLTRKKSDKNKLYSWHETDIDCISKGKAHKKYEFGCKVSLAMTAKKGRAIITSAQVHHGNPYDGHTLKSALANSCKIAGTAAKRVFVDKGYKGHKIEDGVEIYISGTRRGVSKYMRRKMRRRQAIEPHIGHMKNKLKLGLCRLKGIAGDHVNALLSATSYNLRMVLKKLRLLLVKILYQFLTEMNVVKLDNFNLI